MFHPRQWPLTGRGNTGQATKPTRHNRTLTIDFHDETTHIPPRLLLDSRVVDVTRSYNPIFITIASFKPFLFNDLIHEWRFVDRMEA